MGNVPLRCRPTWASLLLAGALSLPASLAAQTQRSPHAPHPSEPFSTATHAEVAASRRFLAEAISQGAYRPPPPPSALERGWARARAWLGRHLGRYAVHPGSTRWPARLLLALAFAAVAILPLLPWLRREWRARRADLSPEPALPTPLAQPWEQLEAEADALAREGRWREGIHRLFWAVVARGETLGRWRRDQTRTAREYLPLVPPGGDGHQALAALLRVFEHVWYGGQTATEPDFVKARLLADQLCRPGAGLGHSGAAAGDS